MSIDSQSLSRTLFAALLLVLLASPSLADELDDDLLAAEDSEIEDELKAEADDATVPEPERLKAFSEVRWSKPTLPKAVDPLVPPIVNDTIAVVAITRSPLTLNALGDLAFLRPATAALGVLGAATYVVVAGPTWALDESKHATLRDGLLYGPWRNLRDRPLGEPTPVPETDDKSEATDAAAAPEAS
jgi:hypothetical protein